MIRFHEVVDGTGATFGVPAMGVESDQVDLRCGAGISGKPNHGQRHSRERLRDISGTINGRRFPLMPVHPLDIRLVGTSGWVVRMPPGVNRILAVGSHIGVADATGLRGVLQEQADGRSWVWRTLM